MIIKKRFGARNFVQYLGLKDTYSIGPKAKRKKQEFLKGGPGYVYKQPPSEKKAYETQQALSVGHSGPWKKFYGGPKDTRSFRWSAKAPPPVPTSYDGLLEMWGTDRRGATLRRRFQQDLQDDYNHNIHQSRNRFRNEHRDWRNAQEDLRTAARNAARNAARREQRASDAILLQQQIDAQRAAERKAKEPGAAVRIQRWAKRMLHRPNWRKELESNEGYPVGVDKATVNYIKNVVMKLDDKDLREWIKGLANEQVNLNEQNGKFFEWAANADKGTGQQKQGGGLFGSSPSKSSGGAPIPFVSPQKKGAQEISSEVRKQLVFGHDDGTQEALMSEDEKKQARKDYIADKSAKRDAEIERKKAAILG